MQYMPLNAYGIRKDIVMIHQSFYLNFIWPYDNTTFKNRLMKRKCRYFSYLEKILTN